jgi:hypothetical protein
MAAYRDIEVIDVIADRFDSGCFAGIAAAIPAKRLLG